MIEIDVSDIVEATASRLVCGDPARTCRGCAIDSRKVDRDAIFVAFPGERVDGNAFAAPALEAGAGCVVMTADAPEGVRAAAEERGAAIVRTDDPTAFMLDLASWWRDRLDARVVGITGSIGKTTTKDVLTALLARRYRVHATSGNFNNLIGLPLTVLSAHRDTEALVVEMGMDGRGQIERLSRCARPDIAVITKVGTSHIGMLGSRENIACAKAEIVCGMRPGGALVMGASDDYFAFIRDGIATPAGIEVVACGSGDGCDVVVSAVELGEDGCPSFDVTFSDGARISTRLSVPGAQAVINAAYAAAVARRMGIDPSEIDAAFGALELTARRVDVRRAVSGARIIDDSYNAAPESVAAGLDLLCSLPCAGSRIAVLGEMGELGEESARLHALTGAYAAAKKLALLVCVGGEGARAMAETARMLGMSDDAVQVMDDTDAAIAALSDAFGPEDLVLVKGSRFVGLDRLVEEVC